MLLFTEKKEKEHTKHRKVQTSNRRQQSRHLLIMWMIHQYTWTAANLHCLRHWSQLWLCPFSYVSFCVWHNCPWLSSRGTTACVLVAPAWPRHSTWPAPPWTMHATVTTKKQEELANLDHQFYRVFASFSSGRSDSCRERSNAGTFPCVFAALIGLFRNIWPAPRETDHATVEFEKNVKYCCIITVEHTKLPFRKKKIF